MMDNTTAVAYINHMGGSKSATCHEITRTIWKWAEQRNIWLSAAHIPGVQNVIADQDSRKFNDSAEWSLTTATFAKLTEIYGSPDIDLFANRLNHKCVKYTSWHPDPTSYATDAFSITWDYNLIYCFPPFSLIWKTLEKIRREERDAVMVIPFWPTQSWFPYAMKLLVATPRVFSSAKKHLYLPHDTTQVHPLYPRMKMMMALLSGKQYRRDQFLRQHKTFSYPPGETARKAGTARRLKNGKHIVINGVPIPYMQL